MISDAFSLPLPIFKLSVSPWKSLNRSYFSYCVLFTETTIQVPLPDGRGIVVRIYGYFQDSELAANSGLILNSDKVSTQPERYRLYYPPQIYADITAKLTLATA